MFARRHSDANRAVSMPPDKKVLLFGRTGDGKSTLANALVTGGRGPKRFRTSDAAQGCTTEIQKETGRGWTVTDTVGLGESQSVAGTNTDATEKLTDFLKKVQDTYSHIIYVKRANRITTLDELTWVIFSNVFRGAEEGFVVVLTGASEGWLEENRAKLPGYLKKQTILVADIPPVHRRAIVEQRRRAIRQRSIENLEANLVRLFEERGEKVYTPEIARLTDLELNEKSRTLVRIIVDAIRRLYDQLSWQKVAAQVGTLVNIVGIVVGSVQLAIAS